MLLKNYPRHWLEEAVGMIKLSRSRLHPGYGINAQQISRIYEGNNYFINCSKSLANWVGPYMTVEDQIQDLNGSIALRGYDQSGEIFPASNTGILQSTVSQLSTSTGVSANDPSLPKTAQNLIFKASAVARTGQYTRVKTHFNDVWIIHGEVA